MKNVFKISILMALFAMTMTGCPPDDEEIVPEPVKNKTVTVGAQSGTITAGTAGTATFAVTTENITGGSYNVTVANLPSGVSVQGQVTISANSGTLTLAGSASAAAGVYSTLALTIDGVASGPFTLTIAAASKTVSVGAQNGKLTAKTVGTVTFPITTASIANGSYSVTVANLPTGVSVQGKVDISAGKGTLTLAGSTSTVAGVYSTLTLTIDGAKSEAFTLTIDAASGASEAILEHGCIMYVRQDGNKSLITFKEKGALDRHDQLYDGEHVSADIVNHKAQAHYHGQYVYEDNEIVGEKWVDIQYAPNYRSVYYGFDENALRQYLQPNKVTVCGKLCNVYIANGITYAVWRGAVLSYVGPGISMTATQIVETAPPDMAFTKSMPITWF